MFGGGVICGGKKKEIFSKKNKSGQFEDTGKESVGAPCKEEDVKQKEAGKKRKRNNFAQQGKERNFLYKEGGKQLHRDRMKQKTPGKTKLCQGGNFRLERGQNEKKGEKGLRVSWGKKNRALLAALKLELEKNK